MTTLSTTPSNYQNVAGALEYRGFRWNPVAMQKVESQSRNISLDDEWARFISCVVEITGINAGNIDANMSQWRFFEHVISPKGGHDNERSFSISLFDALGKSLSDFVNSSLSSVNRIVLKNSSIGFGKGLYRTNLGFNDKYVLSKDSEVDHCCFVLSLNKEECQYDDITAVVELKLEGTSCQSFIFDNVSDEINAPDFVKLHGPMGQAMIYSMDVWHCLARRGISITNLPVVVLAGKGKLNSKSEKAGEMTESHKLTPVCGLEAHIEIPTYCGTTFYYSVDLVIGFDDALVNAKKKAEKSWTSNDGRAIAIYIRALRTGLEHAFEIVKKKKSIFDAPPVSLCCRRLLRKYEGAQLVACPIPHANRIQGSDIVVHLGELFALTKARRKDFAGLPDFSWFIDSTNDAILADTCLVKVNCISVHNAFVRPLLCRDALIKLHGGCVNNSNLKREISKVLLGFSATNNFSLVIVMKDLRNDDFIILNHRTLRDRNRLPELWAAFCNLVKSLLLPMAAVNVIHADIRSSVEITYNILYRFDSTNVLEASSKDSRDVVELQLIDFDSFLLYGSGEDANLNRQDHSIDWKDVNRMQEKVMKMLEAEVTKDGMDESLVAVRNVLDVKMDEENEETKILKKRNDPEIWPCNSEESMELSDHKKQCVALTEGIETNAEIVEIKKDDSAAAEVEEYGAPAYRYLFWQVLWIAYTWHPHATQSATAHKFVLRFLSDDEEFSLYRQWLGSDIVKNIKQISAGDITAKSLELALEYLTNAPWRLSDSPNL